MQKLWNIFLDIIYRPSNFGCIAALLIFIKREAVVEDLWYNSDYDKLKLSLLLPMPLYQLFDYKFSVYKFWLQVFLKSKVQTFPIFLRSGCLGSGRHGDSQQKQRIFQLNSVTSDPVILGSILDVVGTGSPWRSISLVIVSQIVSYNYPLREICRNRAFFSPFPHIRTEYYLHLLLFGKNPWFFPNTEKYDSVHIQENTDPRKPVFGHLAQWSAVV